MRCLMVLFEILIFINFIHASCNEGQININTATEKELEELYGIGPVKANAIIDSRPIDSVDDLIDIYGIGEVTLEKIKEQGLACVENEKVEKDNENIIDKEEKNNNSLLDNYSGIVNSNEEIILEPIKLNSNTKNIKSEDDENLNTKSYAIYGLFGFCMLLAFLFAFKKIKSKKYKNEFN